VAAERSGQSLLNIGVLALQGAFAEHVRMLRQLGVNAVEVRKASQLADLHGLIIPGGESTAISLIAGRWGLLEPLREWVQAGKPVWGTCAGLILLADRIEGGRPGGQALIGGLDVTVSRNHFGRQIDSFRQEIGMTESGLDAAPYPAVFIRAPAITAYGPQVRPLATLSTADGGTITVAVRQGNMLATAFHPELTTDMRWHRYFLALVKSAVSEKRDD
jgi:pyridoxal 5'-phosphate synthase pdxT subunit